MIVKIDRYSGIPGSQTPTFVGSLLLAPLLFRQSGLPARRNFEDRTRPRPRRDEQGFLVERARDRIGRRGQDFRSLPMTSAEGNDHCVRKTAGNRPEVVLVPPRDFFVLQNAFSSGRFCRTNQCWHSSQTEPLAPLVGPVGVPEHRVSVPRARPGGGGGGGGARERVPEEGVLGSRRPRRSRQPRGSPAAGPAASRN